MDDCYFGSNTCTGRRGISNTGGKISVKKCFFSGNQSEGPGGAILHDTNQAVIESCTFLETSLHSITAEALLIATVIFSSKTAFSTGIKQRAPGEGEVGSLTGTLGIHWLRTALSTETALIPAEEWRTGTRFPRNCTFIKIQLKRETMCSLSAEKFQVRRIEQRPSTAFSGMEVPGIRFMPNCPLP